MNRYDPWILNPTVLPLNAMGKKKFIDKKRAVTFQLLARDSSDPGYADSPGGDRVFVRVDNNPISVDSLFGAEDGNGEEDSRFADPPGESELPDHVRKEILELGFPDDGYNYLLHLREIRNNGGGSAFYHNSKARLDMVPADVKAYDASRLRISPAEDDSDERTMYLVASKTVDLRVQKVVDPDVAAMLDDTDWSKAGSDEEVLEEDFVIQANFPDASDEGISNSHGWNHVGDNGCNTNASRGLSSAHNLNHQDKNEFSAACKGGHQFVGREELSSCEMQRARRLLDEQFDVLESQEYGADSEDNSDGYISDEEEYLAQKIKTIHVKDESNDFEQDEKYEGPADLLHKSGVDKKLLNSAEDIIRRCAEYAEKYGSGDEEVEVMEGQISDESEEWDCETIVSTYSNLDNHPGKINAPEVARKKKLAEKLSGALCSNKPVIPLKGKEKLPVDFLPHKRTAVEKTKGVSVLNAEAPKRRRNIGESKEEKKERKAAVKDKRREARRMKKEVKGLYQYEAQLAQKNAAVSGPSSIHLM